MDRQINLKHAELLTFAHRLADLSAEATLKHFRQPVAVDNKAGSSGYDPVTDADRESETAIAREIARVYPEHGLHGEEFGRRASQGPFRWVVDPIDGTRAYIMGSPLWGTLIGLMKDDEPFLGLMDQPFTGERYWSTADAALTRRGTGPATRLSTRRCATLADAVMTSTHPDLFQPGRQAAVLDAFKPAVRMTRYGGDCYGYVLLAAGFVDLIVEPGLNAYDIAALIPIIENAGGRITTWSGTSARDGGDIIASGDPALHDKAVALIAGVN